MTTEFCIEPPTEAAMLNERQAGEFLSLSVPKLRKMRAAGQGPRWVNIGRNVRYPVDAARAWVASLAQEAVTHE